MKPYASALLVTLLCIYLGLRPERCDAQCPVTLPPTIVNTPCPNQTQLDAIKSQISTQIAAKFNNSTLGGCIQTYGSSRIKPATSCQQILIAYPTSSSGYYWVINSTGVAIQVYCRFDRFTNFTFFGLDQRVRKSSQCQPNERPKPAVPTKPRPDAAVRTQTVRRNNW